MTAVYGVLAVAVILLAVWGVRRFAHASQEAQRRREAAAYVEAWENLTGLPMDAMTMRQVAMLSETMQQWQALRAGGVRMTAREFVADGLRRSGEAER